MKFGFALDRLEDVSKRWDKYADFIRAYPAPENAEEGSNYKALLSNMTSKKEAPYARATGTVGWHLCELARPLLMSSQKHVHFIPVDF